MAFVPGESNLLYAGSDTLFAVNGGAGYFYKLAAVDIHGNESGFALLTPSDITGVLGTNVPLVAWLAPAAPNPAPGSSVLRFALQVEGRVTLTLYDPEGRKVRELVGGMLSAGEHAVAWDGRDDVGREVPVGLYCFRLQAGGKVLVQRLALIR